MLAERPVVLKPRVVCALQSLAVCCLSARILVYNSCQHALRGERVGKSLTQADFSHDRIWNQWSRGERRGERGVLLILLCRPIAVQTLSFSSSPPSPPSLFRRGSHSFHHEKAFLLTKQNEKWIDMALGDFGGGGAFQKTNSFLPAEVTNWRCGFPGSHRT